jgi:hypothetical protein
LIVNSNDLVFTATSTLSADTKTVSMPTLPLESIRTGSVIPWSTLSNHPDIQQMVDRLVQIHLDEILQSDWFIDLVDQRILEAFELTNEEESAC